MSERRFSCLTAWGRKVWQRLLFDCLRPLIFICFWITDGEKWCTYVSAVKDNQLRLYPLYKKFLKPTQTALIVDIIAWFKILPGHLLVNKVRLGGWDEQIQINRLCLTSFKHFLRDSQTQRQICGSMSAVMICVHGFPNPQFLFFWTSRPEQRTAALKWAVSGLILSPTESRIRFVFFKNFFKRNRWWWASYIFAKEDTAIIALLRLILVCMKIVFLTHLDCSR